MTTGGYHPGPFRTGGAAGSRLQRIVESLQAQKGTAYSTSPTSAVYVGDMANARAIDRDGYGASERLANNFVPGKMTAATGMLQRWERIFALTPALTDSEGLRNQRVVAAWARVGMTNAQQAVTDALTAALGPVFVAIEHQDLVTGLSYWPGNPGPPGIPWYSTIAHVLVRCQKPAGYTEGQFYAATGLIGPIVDPLLPAWATWDWYRYASSGVRDFLLDDAHNLDNEVFSV